MTTKYKAVFGRIEQVNIAKETAKQVVLMQEGWNGKPRRESKVTDWYSYHETFEGAKASLVEKAESDIRKCEMAMNRAKKQLNDANSLENK